VSGLVAETGLDGGGVGGELAGCDALGEFRVIALEAREGVAGLITTREFQLAIGNLILLCLFAAPVATVLAEGARRRRMPRCWLRSFNFVLLPRSPLRSVRVPWWMVLRSPSAVAARPRRDARGGWLFSPSGSREKG